MIEHGDACQHDARHSCDGRQIDQHGMQVTLVVEFVKRTTHGRAASPNELDTKGLYSVFYC